MAENKMFDNLPKIEIALNTSDNDLAAELYSPCLRWAQRYDRAVGFLTTGWLKNNLFGMSNFASRGGKIRLIVSPIISNADYDAIISASDDSVAFERLQIAIKENVTSLAIEMGKNLYNAFAWMIHDGIIDIKFAVPTGKLDGMFHSKFGVFYKGEHAIAFTGSINDSEQGFSNGEDINVFKTWDGSGVYVNTTINRFEKLWNKEDKNIKIYNISQGVKDHIFTLRSSEDRPYKKADDENKKWEHQDIAVEKFLEVKRGVLAMATGTGKTVTAKKIMQRLLEDKAIKRIIVTMAGNDLLDQWSKQLLSEFDNMPVYKQYGETKAMGRFVVNPDYAIMLLSSDADNLSKLLNMLEKLPGNYKDDTLFVFDEIHGMGSSTRVENLSGKLKDYTYKLGLSATPEREYDEEGNGFIEDEIGPVIYRFGLEEAIKKGILCPFNYIPLEYELTEEEKQKKKKIIAAFNAKKKNRELVSDNELYTQLAKINKTAEEKLIAFADLLETQPEILEKCIIFVETMEYGEKVQEILLKHIDRYHTYYADDEKVNLERFASGELECLLTCKKVSEGIDISRVTNIVLFASDRSKLVTTQRIGRALRLDPQNEEKIANVVDFVMPNNNPEDVTADEERSMWLTNLSQIRRDIDA